MRQPALLVLALVLTTAGCKKITEGAREHFSKDFTCPTDRVEVRERRDLHPSDFKAQQKPPADVAADPERLKMWQAEENKNRAWADGHDEIIEARGCGHQSLYACHRHSKDKNYVMCSQEAYAPGMTKW